MKPFKRSASTIIPFPSLNKNQPPVVVVDEFTSERSSLILKTRSAEGAVIPAAFHVAALKSSWLEERNALLEFQVELRYERFNQVLLFGLVNSNHSQGIAIAVDPTSGAVTDAINGMGVLGHIPALPYGSGHCYCCSLRIHKFGNNYICAVFIDGDSIMYPAFASDCMHEFNGMVGTDINSGPEVTYRQPQIALERIAKVAA